MLLAVVRLLVARQRGDPSAVVEQAQRLQAVAEAPDAAQPGPGAQLRALALISLGITEAWAGQLEGQRHPEHGATLARSMKGHIRSSSPGYQAVIELCGSFTVAGEYDRQAIGLAGRHGWTVEAVGGFPVACSAGDLS